MNSIIEVVAILPEIALSLTAVCVLFLDLLFKNKRLINFIVLLSLGTILVYLCNTPALNVSLFSGMLVSDNFIVFCKRMSVFIAVIIVLISLDYKDISDDYRAEFYSLLLIATSAIMFLSGTNNLLMIYLGVEFLSLVSYIIAAYWRGNLSSSENGLKYFLIGTTSSITMLYGISLLYGLTGSLDLHKINAVLYTSKINPIAFSMIILMVLVGLGFKIAMVPVHFWCPDVFESAPTPVSAFFSVEPKVAGFAVLFRFLFVGTPFFYRHWAHALGILAVITMTVGNVTALTQANIKRLLAFSSIAHVGYALIGLIIGRGYGQLSLYIYILVYVIMNLGAFAVVTAVYNNIKSDEIKDYAGLARHSPYLAGMLSIFLLSLAGIPPLAGFIGKFYLLAAAIKEGVVYLVVAAVINSVIASYYYLLIIKTMYMSKPVKEVVIKHSFSLNCALVILLALVLFLGIYPKPLIDFAANAMNIVY